MLPESKEYLRKDDWSEQQAGLIMMGCFIAGFIGIQAISRLLHQFIPSHVVDCDHSHEETATQDSHSCDRSRRQSRRRRISRRRSSRPAGNGVDKLIENGDSHAAETTPLLSNGNNTNGAPKSFSRHASVRGDELPHQSDTDNSLALARGRSVTNDSASISRRPSMLQVQKRVLSFVKDTKCNCDELGSCYGFTDPCGQECFKHINNRGPPNPRHGTILRTTTGPFYPHSGSIFHGSHQTGGEEAGEASISPRFRTSRATSRDPLSPAEEEEEEEDLHCESHGSTCSSLDGGDGESQHHHHVPTNAFLSIGLQTSIAIALHKFPEGFITYATNHANPSLGFNVFMALFVHNISEGFAMALPLYMALGSRWRAMLWSALLGGLSQPMGAAIAVLWFKLASRTNISPNSVAYACLFAVTAGIMVSVALQLFVESLSLSHNRNLCIFFGFIGMSILGLSNALLGGH